MRAQIVQDISDGRVIAFRLETNMNDPDFADPIIQFLRRMTSWEMLRHPERYASVILDEEEEEAGSGKSPQGSRKAKEDKEAEACRRRMAKHCRKHVDRMGEEAEEWHMQALSRVLQVPIMVESIANSERAFSYRIWEEDNGSPASQLPAPNATACLLYVPGHYEIIYPR